MKGRKELNTSCLELNTELPCYGRKEIKHIMLGTWIWETSQRCSGKALTHLLAFVERLD